MKPQCQRDVTVTGTKELANAIFEMVSAFYPAPAVSLDGSPVIKFLGAFSIINRLDSLVVKRPLRVR